MEGRRHRVHSARILGDGCEKFRLLSVEGAKLNEERIAQSVMLVTALSPVLGYEKSAQIAQRAMRDGSTLREAALNSGDVDAATYDKVAGPKAMVWHGVGGA